MNSAEYLREIRDQLESMASDKDVSSEAYRDALEELLMEVDQRLMAARDDERADD